MMSVSPTICLKARICFSVTLLYCMHNYNHRDTETQRMCEKERNNLSKIILDTLIEVHKQLGPGLLEIVYEICLCKELYNRNI
ncbi:MAG: GxxExxY protein, partial [Bacteroidota bacterium]